MKLNVNIPAGVSGDFEIAHYTKDTTDNRWPLYLSKNNEAYDKYTVTHHILIENPNITSITIIEKYQDVIDLVWDNCVKDERFNLIHADINTWEIPADSHWDIGWFDTWISDGDWGEYKTNMKEKYGPYITKINGWCW